MAGVTSLGTWCSCSCPGADGGKGRLWHGAICARRLIGAPEPAHCCSPLLLPHAAQSGHLPLLILDYYSQEQSDSTITKALACVAGLNQVGEGGRKARAGCTFPFSLSVNESAHAEIWAGPSEAAPTPQAPGRVAGLGSQGLCTYRLCLSPAAAAPWRLDVAPRARNNVGERLGEDQGAGMDQEKERRKCLFS